MKRNRMLIGAGLAIVIGLLASRYVYTHMAQASKPDLTITRVVVAAQPLPLGTRVGPENLRLVSWPINQQLPGSFNHIEECADRALITSVIANEPILEARLAPKAAGVGLPAVIPEGLRAVSVRVDDVVDVAGFAEPSTMVDVQVTCDTGGGTSTSGVTNTILQDVRVLAAGQKVEQDKEGKPLTVAVVTLLVNPEQANQLTMAATGGHIHLVLRNTIDTKLTAPAPVYMSSLLGVRPPSPILVKVKRDPPLSPPPLVVEVIRGDKKDTATFPR